MTTQEMLDHIDRDIESERVMSGQDSNALIETMQAVRARVEAFPALVEVLTEGVELEAGELVGAEFKLARNEWLRKARAVLSQLQEPQE